MTAATRSPVDAAPVGVYFRRMADEPSLVTLPATALPAPIRRRRRPASGEEQQRRKAWGRKWGALVSAAVKQELGRMDDA